MTSIDMFAMYIKVCQGQIGECNPGILQCCVNEVNRTGLC